MPRIEPDPVSLTTHHVHLGLRETDTVLSSATAFTYEHGDDVFLVTNWHNVTGRDPVTHECLSGTLATPDVLSTVFRESGNLGRVGVEHIRLFHDDEMRQPVWFEHPTFGRQVDVVAIQLSAEWRSKYHLAPVNRNDFDPQFRVQVGDDAFVIGYPFSDHTPGQLPIWKRATIATEPDVDIDALPKLLLDTATRPGLSGSPVVMQRTGLHGMSGGQLTGETIIGRIRNFVGVYSGRIGADEVKAQLGIVWKASVIPEIVAARALGSVAHEV